LRAKATRVFAIGTVPTFAARQSAGKRAIHVKQNHLWRGIGCVVVIVGKFRICRASSASSQRAMAHPQWSQHPADREWTEIIASQRRDAGSGARDRPVIQRAAGGPSGDQQLIERRSAHEIRLATIEDDRHCGRHRGRRQCRRVGPTAPDRRTRVGNGVAMQPRGIRRHLQSPLNA
jgi:hypothetical protein